MNKKKRKLFFIINIVSLVFIILTGTILSSVENLKLYEKSYSKYDVYNKYELEFAISKVKNIFEYFKSKEELDSTFFSEDEISHLYDVKVLLLKLKVIFYVSFIVFIIISNSLFKSNKLKQLLPFIFIYSGVIIIGFIFLLFLIYVFSGFNFLFTSFHKIFFIDNWLFDPRVSNMINLFPEEYFFDMALSVLIKIFIYSSILIIIGIIFARKRIFR